MIVDNKYYDKYTGKCPTCRNYIGVFKFTGGHNWYTSHVCPKIQTATVYHNPAFQPTPPKQRGPR